MRTRHLILVFCLLALAVPAARADQPAAAPSDAVSDPSDVAPALTAFQHELADAFAAETEALDRLYAAARAATDAQAAMEIQKEIADTKEGTELRVLGIQARHARLRGNEARAREIEQTIEALKEPRVPRRPVDRPAPGTEPK